MRRAPAGVAKNKNRKGVHTGAQRRSAMGDDGLSDRERKYVDLRRRDPTRMKIECAAEAGFKGPHLGFRVQEIEKREAVQRALVAPVVIQLPPDASIKDEVRAKLLAILRGGASDSDKIKACDKLLATIAGGYVPVGVQHSGSLTLDGLLDMADSAEPTAHTKEETVQ